MIKRTEVKRLEDLPAETHEHAAIIQRAPEAEQKEFWKTLGTYMDHPKSSEMTHQEISDILDREGVKGLTAKMREIETYGDTQKSFNEARAKEKQDRYKRLSKPGGF
jgi:hypothetical protein